MCNFLIFLAGSELVELQDKQYAENKVKLLSLKFQVNVEAYNSLDDNKRNRKVS